MAEPHNYRKVGWSMVLVSASLTAIALLGLAIGEDVLYADNIQREKTAIYEECMGTQNFEDPQCFRFLEPLIFEDCMANKDLDSPQCFKFQTWVESKIFEDCRTERDTESLECQKYKHLIPLETESEIEEEVEAES